MKLLSWIRNAIGGRERALDAAVRRREERETHICGNPSFDMFECLACKNK